MARLDYDALNSTLRYLMFSVFSVTPGVLGDDRSAILDEAATFFKRQEDGGVAKSFDNLDFRRHVGVPDQQLA